MLWPDVHHVCPLSVCRDFPPVPLCRDIPLADVQRRSELENLLTTLTAELSERLEDLQQAGAHCCLNIYVIVGLRGRCTAGIPSSRQIETIFSRN